MDGAGNLYGATVADGTYGYGNVLKLARSDNGWMYAGLHDFTCGADGGYPYDGLVLDADGNVYGTTSSGGMNNLGVVFEVTL
jgi:uncharacterized repeat protein (TIGR03803 family)